MADVAVTSADVSVNGGSDSEAVKSKTVVEGHVRSASTVKKPISFKAVSVNKTFLAAKGAAGPASTKTGDKGPGSSISAPSAQSASAISKPRLVAKSGSNLVSTLRTSATGAGGKSGTAPDASAVWNKNRRTCIYLLDNVFTKLTCAATPVPEPKRVTDEELAEKYGIHLATRLQSDDPGRQANWADIDDDDDDWAPQSIEWSDGTKITMPQQVEEPVPEPVTLAPATVTNNAEKPASPAPTMPSTMKLGGMSGGTGRGLILKGASEKPTLVAKPPAPPTPVKSPWASLPPMDKIAPIVTDLHSQQQQTLRFASRDPHGFEAMPPPAKEIAADDFSRSWRDGNTGASKELYNSQSGRYEPVSDGRRGSRNEMHPRQLALLQRHHETQGPAEPSAAFQTHRANLQDVQYGRRRTSSNVSGGSGIYGRRLSRGQDGYPPHDMLGARRGSMVAVGDEPSPRLQSPSGHPGQRSYPQQQWQPRASPVVSHASPASVHGHLALPTQLSTPTPPATAAAPVVQLEDEVELQKKIMRESRELARKRRLDEEAREEAERKERIRLKLEAMGPAPETKKSKKDTPKDEKATPTQIQTRDAASKPTGPPKPPISDPTGEVKQYGMMKVHPAEPVKAVAATPEPGISQLNEAQVSGEAQLNDIHHVMAPRGDVEAQAPPTQPQSWQSSQSSGPDHRFPNWASSGSNPAQGRSVWGPPTNDRTLGNGTFDPELSVQPSQLAQGGPGPIAPPSNSRANGQYQGRGREQYAQRPAPIGPPSRHQDQKPLGASAWTSGNIQPRLADDDARIQAEQENLQTSRPGDPPVVIKDTWRQVTLSSEGQRDVKAPVHTIIGASSAGPVPTWTDYSVRPRQDDASQLPAIEQGAVWPQGHINDTTSASVAFPPSRGSRFFPKARDLPRDLPVEEHLYARPGSPSPPPPTMAGHPAYDGDVARPHVSLPRPPPVVKLPPAPVLAPIAPPKPASFAAAAAAAAAKPSRPSAASPSSSKSEVASSLPPHAKNQSSGAGGWQDKINSLMGRRTSPKSHALAVDSSSKHAFDHSSNQIPATVSLPGISITAGDQGTYETKPMAEECFEEQEMGYVPTVKVPNQTPQAAYFLVAPQTKPLPRKFIVSDVTSANSLNFAPQITKEGETILILLPGMDANKRVSVAHKLEPRQKSNPRRSGQGRGNSQRHASSPHTRGGRARDTSNAFPTVTTEQGPPSASPGSSSQRGGRGRGGFGSTWGPRHATTPPGAINV